MKFKIKSLDSRNYKEVEEFKKLGYVLNNQTKHFIKLLSYKNTVLSKEIELYPLINRAIKIDRDSGALDPFTKEELKILDVYNWDLHDYMLHPVGQHVADWMDDHEI